MLSFKIKLKIRFFSTEVVGRAFIWSKFPVSYFFNNHNLLLGGPSSLALNWARRNLYATDTLLTKNKVFNYKVLWMDYMLKSNELRKLSQDNYSPIFVSGNSVLLDYCRKQLSDDRMFYYIDYSRDKDLFGKGITKLPNQMLPIKAKFSYAGMLPIDRTERSFKSILGFKKKVFFFLGNNGYSSSSMRCALAIARTGAPCFSPCDSYSMWADDVFRALYGNIASKKTLNFYINFFSYHFINKRKRLENFPKPVNPFAKGNSRYAAKKVFASCRLNLYIPLHKRSYRVYCERFKNAEYQIDDHIVPGYYNHIKLPNYYGPEYTVIKRALFYDKILERMLLINKRRKNKLF